MAVAALDREQQILCLAARTALDDDATTRLAQRLDGPLDWERLWAQAHVHEVAPLVTETLRRLGPGAGVSPAWMERARRRLYATLLHNRRLRDELLVVLDVLQDAGVEATAVKGVVLAQTLYANLALRPTADLDVLVRPDDLVTARAALAGLGYAHAPESPFEALHHPYHDPQYYRATAAGEVCLELHHALWASRFWGADDGLWERRVAAELGGRPIRVLSGEDTLLHLAIHRARSPLRLRHLCDIAELLRMRGAALDWELVGDGAKRIGARTALHTALTLSDELLDAAAPAHVLRALGVGPLKRAVLARTCGPRVLFRPADPDDLEQQPHLTLRAFEQDGPARIVRTLAHAPARKAHKLVHAVRRRARRPLSASAAAER